MAQAEADYYAELRSTASGRQYEEEDAQRAAAMAKPFGFENERWGALKAQMRPGDELWEFCSSRSSWDALMGMAGYALVRDGVVIAEIITRLN